MVVWPFRFPSREVGQGCPRRLRICRLPLTVLQQWQDEEIHATVGSGGGQTRNGNSRVLLGSLVLYNHGGRSEKGRNGRMGKAKRVRRRHNLGSATEYLVIIWAPSLTRNGREINMAAVQEGLKVEVEESQAKCCWGG